MGRQRRPGVPGVPRPPQAATPQPSTTDLITLIRFEWTTKSGSQPVLFVERRLLD
jgi:hypothetical protein